ncbi:LysR family transcriptional regulator [Paenibacillus glucanolyticus]|uniref:LysR family transcriptional regulator n=1 Tax=Paenibacillus glucanolyticus TaxID=59843 RepID=A0A163H2Z8_9BACL|nr:MULTISPECIES: LysR family transcriptional regulator [Paenibacillus]AWP25872.1 LysR family transcriptional regulator [Paenibacillus sp. Cedars]KZS45291.1 LysR family transcriptional regulator [Paenibacillus glucanolyticus]
MEINMEWYRVFYWTSRLGSLSKAAEHLHITQPAVSHTIKHLEGTLGGPLFFRTTKGVKLTSEGAVLFRYIEQAFSFIEIGEKAIGDMHNLHSGEINIGASDTLCKYYLLPHLEHFHAAYPDIRIRITNRTTPETLVLLKEGKIDFGIVHLPASDKQIDFRASSPIQDCLVAGKPFAERANIHNPLPLPGIQDFPLLMLEGGGSTRRYIDQYAAQQGVTLKPEFELGSIELLVQFARSGFGLAFIIRDYASEEFRTGQLVEVPLHPPIPERSIGIATLRGIPLSAAAKSFLSLLP